MKRSLFIVLMAFIGWYGVVMSGDSKLSSEVQVITPMDDYVAFLNEKVEKLTGDVASKTAKVDQLKKVVTELEQKQSVTKKIGMVGELAKDDGTKKQADAEYLERKKELDAVTAALETAADALTMLTKQKAAYEYTKSKLFELEQIMAGAAQMNLDDAEIAALAEDDGPAGIEGAAA